MAVFPSEDRIRLKRIRSEKAIQLAMQNRWDEAVEINRQILELFPDDVDTYNRLGKALMELGHYAEARDAYQESARRDPSNTIAAKNVARLSKLADEAAAGAAPVQASGPVDPRLFIEESGKTAVTTLVDVAPFEQIATFTAGDKMDVQIDGGVVRIVSPTGQVIGQVEPKLAQRIVKLTGMGNKYEAAATSLDESHVRVIVRETFRDASMGARPSFPTQAPEIRPYTKDTMFRTDLDDDEDLDIDEVERDVDSEAAGDTGLDEPALADDADLADER